MNSNSNSSFARVCNPVLHFDGGLDRSGWCREECHDGVPDELVDESVVLLNDWFQSAVKFV